MADLRVGIIGFGGRMRGLMEPIRETGVPFKVVAVADPRAEELKARKLPILEGAAFHADADAMLAAGGLDGVMIGTRCSLHSRMACKVAPLDIPLFLEKPVATSFADLGMLARAFAGKKAPVVVSHPLRVSPLARRTKELLDSGEFGPVRHIVAFNDVPYGEVYYAGWYRDYAEMGGLFLQKATHDFDYITYLAGSRPKRVCAMKAQGVYGAAGKPPFAGKPFDLKCKDCPDKGECPESPFSGAASMIPEGSRKAWAEGRMCMFSPEVLNEDSGNAIVEYEGGVQASYTQNFYARHRAARRGARIHCYRGTVEFDWYTNEIRIMRHDRNGLETVGSGGDEAHFGGDIELIRDFMAAMQGRHTPRTPLETGIQSALLCLHARESADRGEFREVVMPS